MSISPVPLSAQDTWGVGPDGSVIIVRSADYHAEWIGPDGSVTREYSWPDTKPAFYGDRIPVDPKNRAWVHRHTPAGGNTLYDLFDRSGARIGTVVLPPERRVVGFAPGVIYAVAFDAFDLAYLEGYSLP